jgi:hypothetical protein
MSTWSPSDAHHPVELLQHAGELGRRHPVRVQPRDVFVGRPTGDRAALSDVDGNLVVEKLLEQLAQRRHADALDAFGRRPRGQLGGVAGEGDGALLARLD